MPPATQQNQTSCFAAPFRLFSVMNQLQPPPSHQQMESNSGKVWVDAERRREEAGSRKQEEEGKILLCLAGLGAANPGQKF